jgi:multiple sugar transport system substrate-binding protein
VARLLRGINWGHRRAVGPLSATAAAFRAEHPDIVVEWSQRTLAGFEADPVPKLAERFDLIVLDHPFCGDIAETDCLVPLDDLPGLGDDLFIGPSLPSYRYAGHMWALPIDAACQVAASRPDLLALLGAEPPATWDEALRLGSAARARGLSLAIGLNGVHSLMTFFTLCANVGSPCRLDPEEPLVEPDVANAALDAVQELVALCPSEVLDWDSIALHEHMVADGRLVFCPAVYLYATYAEADHASPLRFHDLPGLRGTDPSGSTLGGTGLGISSRCEDVEAALLYAGFLLRPEVQTRFAAHHGQPARMEAWTDPAANAQFGGAFSDTRATMKAAWIRPRYAGYLHFQSKAGELVENHLRGALSRVDLLGRMNDLHRRRGRDA